MSFEFTLADAFRARRFYIDETGGRGGHSRPASVALDMARADIESGRIVYARANARGVIGVNFGAVMDESGKRKIWVEDPHAIGLRFIGFADEVCSSNYAYRGGIDHRGWFTNDFQDETARGVVYQLPAKNGRARFMHGVADPVNEGAAMLAYEISEGARENNDRWGASYNPDAREAAQMADSMAENFAEIERDYNRASSAAFEHEELGESVKTWRRELLEMLRERRALRETHAPAICKGIRARVSDLLESINEAREKRAELVEIFESHEAFRA